MTATLAAEGDQYTVILYTCMFQSGMTIMPIGYKDITPERQEPQLVTSVMLKPRQRIRHALRVLFRGRARIDTGELE